jgi:hypothetical protein
MPDKPFLEWEELLSSAARLQSIAPDAVLVGGTKAIDFFLHEVEKQIVSS